ncbi:unnamed protein product [Symbiodinium natans]|uniref:Major facilitator superfamily (MFS) profile domain-containing protein n=1 Tax=Symbiodinium natans TaxID=878477 RepID=A0A812I4H8_9DINO|nr:unnamed protein product [Symbiodinium natans]
MSSHADAAPSIIRRGDQLTPEQVRLQSDQGFRRAVTAIVCAAAFFDIAGAIILQPAVPMIMSNAPGSVRPASWPEGYRHPHAFPRESFSGVSYAFAVNLVLIVNQLGNMISNMAMGTLSDKYGRKPLMLLGLFCGLASLALYYVAGIAMRSFWAFLSCSFVNGLFGGNKTVIQAYVKDIWGTDFPKVQPILFFCFMLGGAGGGLLGGVATSLVQVDEISGNLFIAGPICASLSFLLFLVILFKMPEAPRFEKQAFMEGPKEALPTYVRRILVVLIIGGAADAFGDQGNTFARNTIFSNRYPAGKEVGINMALLMVKAFGLVIAMFVVLVSSRRLGLAPWCVIGNLCSAAAQFAVIPNTMPFEGFIAIWSTSQVFGFTSTLATNFLLPRFAPPDQMGTWMGLNNSANLFGQCFAPLLMSAMYSSLSPADGSPAAEFQMAESVCLATCGSISMLAFLLFLPLLRLIPKKDPWKSKVLNLDDKKMEEYEAMSAREWVRLDGLERFHVNEKRREQGLPPILQHWTDYEEDMLDGGVEDIAERSHKELRDIRRRLTAMLTNRDMLQESIAKHNAIKADIPKLYDLDSEMKKAGAWLTGYLNDAGYHQWPLYPELFKSMIMTAFPPLGPLGKEKADVTSIPEMEMYMMSFLRTLDQHLHTQRYTQMSGLRTLGATMA